MAMAIPIAMAAAAAISAISAIKQGQAAKAAAKYNAQIAEQNADLARQEAADQAVQQRRENYLRLGAIRAAQGHSGGTGDSGSVLDVLGDAAAQGELERQDIVYRGELKARGFTNTATLEEFSGRNAQTAGYLKAGSALLSGASDVYKLTRT